MVETPDGAFSASAAMSFLLTAIPYVDDTGTIVAVLPSGCLYNLKDRRAWEYLGSKYSAWVVSNPRKGAFPGLAASTVLVRLSPPDRARVQVEGTLRAPPICPKLSVTVIRGSQPMHLSATPRKGPVLVHSTDLRQGVVHLNGRRGTSEHRCVAGPAVLIPRVGRITDDKVVLLRAPTPIVMSDCVIALKTASLARARAVQKRLRDSFAILRAHYVGTGAPFITLRRLETVLHAVGIAVREG